MKIGYPFIISKETGTKSWGSWPDDTYEVTGVDKSNKRFKITSHSYCYAISINVWRGSLWLNRKGKRFLIKRITN